MDHNFDDAMNMAESIEVDFGEAETVITEAMDHDMVMDFDLNQQKPILMDTAGDAVVTEYLNDFTLPSGSEYVPQNDIPITSASVSEPAVVIPNQNPEPVFQMQSFEGKTVVVHSQDEPSAFVITRPPGRPPRQIAPAPKIVPIAPKPAPAPSPSATTNKPTFKLGNFQMKKLTVSNAIPGQKQVLAQIGQQLVVMPANSGPKFRIVPPGGAGQPMQAQIISGKAVLSGPGHKQILMKIPGIGNTDQPAVLTKIVPQNSAQPSKVMTMHPKTIPVNNVMLTKVLSRPQQQVNAKQQGVATKKVIITSNAAQSLIRKQAVDGKFVTKLVQPKLTTEGQQTQIHQIHVPGKGVQYIRLVTNSNAPTNINKRPVVNKPQADVSFAPRNTFLIDDKGHMVPVAVGNKAVTTATAASSENSIIVTSGNKGSKPAAAQNAGFSRKLVRIAPVTSRAMAQPGSASVKTRLDSLLASTDPEKVEVLPAEQEPHDTKAALQALIEEIVDGNVDSQTPGKSMPDMSDSDGTMDISQIKQEPSWVIPTSTPKPEAPKEHPLIVIPPDFYAPTPREERKIKYGKMTFDLGKVEDINSSQDDEIDQPSSPGHLTDKELDLLKPRKACNCTKSKCLKLYCDCFANGEFCNNCNCNNCHNNLESEEARQKAIRSCLERNPSAFRPKIGKTKTTTGPAAIRRHNKGCNCKRSGCLKNYCECYEAKIACSSICKCVGCRNVDDRFDSIRRREFDRRDTSIGLTLYRSPNEPLKQPCMFMTSEVIDAVCQCLLAAAGDDGSDKEEEDQLEERDPMKCVIEEFSRCLQDIISASHQPPPTLDETGA